jgi:hypothetical protein
MAAAKLSLESVYFVWLEQDIMFKRNAISFDPTINLSNTTGTSRTPAMAAFENNVYVVWDDDTPGNSEIFYRKSTDGGASFGGPVNLSNTVGRSSGPAMVTSMVPQQDMYVVWTDDSPGYSGIRYRKSTDGGASFGPNMFLDSYYGSYEVAVSGNNVYFVYAFPVRGNYEIFYRKSTDGGASFGRPVNLSNTTVNSGSPRVAASSNLSL